MNIREHLSRRANRIGHGSGSQSSVWRAVLVFTCLALVWAAIVFLTGGFVLRTSGGSVSSRDPTRPVMAAVVLGALYAWRRRHEFRRDVAAIAQRNWAPVIARACVLMALLYAIERGTFFGAGPDQSGYVSQADGWAHAQLTWSPPAWAQQGHWTNAVWSSAPVGYKPTAHGFIAPVFSPGLPLMMAAFELIGGRDAVFYVVPLLAAVAVWMTYLLGVAVSGAWAGAIAAVLLLCSPTFIDWLSQPMSDIPVMACWTIALLFAWRPDTRGALGAGVATAVAILIRPNLAPLAVVPALLLLIERPSRVRRAIVFVLAIVPSIALIAVLNARWWGSPLTSGYGENGSLYAAAHIVPNLRRYLAWLTDTQTPVVFAGLLAPFVVARSTYERRRLLLVTIVFPVLVFALYLPYLEFEEWTFLRFLLPAFPAMLAGLGAVMAHLARRAWSPPVAAAAIAIVTVSVAAVEVRFADKVGATREMIAHEPFARAVDFARTLPRNTILVSNSFSGTLHFYTGRDVLRYEVVSSQEMDSVLDALRAQGHPLYFIGHDFEVGTFKRLFSGSRAAAGLDDHRVPYTDGYAIANLSE